MFSVSIIIFIKKILFPDYVSSYHKETILEEARKNAFAVFLVLCLPIAIAVDVYILYSVRYLLCFILMVYVVSLHFTILFRWMKSGNTKTKRGNRHGR